MSNVPNIKYRPAVITFLDILGFRERVARSKDATEVARILRSLRHFSDVEAYPETLVDEEEDEVTRSKRPEEVLCACRVLDDALPER